MKPIVIFFTFFFCIQSKAQKIIEATSQGWAGGVCCVSGVNYSSTIHLKQEPKSIEIVGIYLPNTGRMSGEIVRQFQSNGSSFCTINFGTRINEGDDPIKEEIKVVERRIFEGAALIILKVDEIIIQLIVDEFDQLEFLAYP